VMVDRSTHPGKGAIPSSVTLGNVTGEHTGVRTRRLAWAQGTSRPLAACRQPEPTPNSMSAACVARRAYDMVHQLRVNAGSGGHMRFSLAGGLALFALATAPGQIAAQAAAPRHIAPSPDAVAATARLRWMGVQPLELNRPFAMPVTIQTRGDKRQGEILMIVGAAGIVTGLLVDEDLVTIAGAAVGGFGLYRYLRATR
jgi:hypothetical protein